jgi:hypothetical protein
MTDAIDICFIDIETLGLHPDAPIWEFAAIRRFHADPVDDGKEDRTQFFIRHEPGPFYDDLPEEFQKDYQNRYTRSDALTESSAAIMIHIVTRGAKIVGCNPGFDLERLTKLLVRNRITPEWHYHPLDITSIALGYYAAVDEKPPTPPWRSEQMAEAVGVETADYKRHTAMGDVVWVRAQWDAVMHP